MGAVSVRKDRISKILGLMVGAVAPPLIYSKVDALKKMDPKLFAALVMGAGFFLPTFVKAKMAQDVGDGMMVSGGISLLDSFGVLSGIPSVSGWRDLQVVNGPGSGTSTSKLREARDVEVLAPSTAQFMNSYFNRRDYDGH
jgi:hypothetical protein